MRNIIFALFILGYSNLFTQKVINKEFSIEGNIVLTEGIEIPKVNKGYTLWLPESGKINGLIVFTHSRRDTMNCDSFMDYALYKQLAVLYATTENRLEFFFDDDQIQEIENYIFEVLMEHNIPKDNLLYCGMSLEGTRALKLATFGISKRSKYKLRPRAIVICDAPLDMVRFHKSMLKAKELNYNAIAANEGKWVSGYLEANLGGTPKNNLSAYVDYSPYSYFADTNKDLHYFKNIALRAYTEPDVEWWIDTRRKDYYGMNAVDMAGIVNELKIIGNQDAELIITHDEGYYSDGTRHPHNWNIVDEIEMVDWFIDLLSDK